MSSLLDVALATADGLRLDGAFVAADQAYRNILASHPESGMAWRGFALLAHAAGEQELARQIMQDRAVPLLPQDQRHLAVADLLRFIVMKRDSGAPLDDGDTQSVSLAYDVINAQIAANQWVQSVDLLRQLRRIYPTDAAVTGSLAACLHNLAVFNQYDFPAAIAYAEEACALTPDNPQILIALVDFYSKAGMLEKRLAILERMIELFDRNAPQPGPPRGLQNLQVTSASAEQIADALLSDGVVLLRGILDDEAQSHFLRFAGHPYLEGAETVTSPLPPVTLDAMALVFKRPPSVFNPASVVRTASMSNDKSYLHYHQDVTPLHIMGATLWAALDPIDGTRPGLEMLVRRQHKAFAAIPADHRPEIAPYRIPDEAVRGVFPDSDFVAPRMEKGDGMMFLSSTIHRTHLTPGMVNSRRSIELRFI